MTFNSVAELISASAVASAFVTATDADVHLHQRRIPANRRSTRLSPTPQFFGGIRLGSSLPATIPPTHSSGCEHVMKPWILFCLLNYVQLWHFASSNINSCNCCLHLLRFLPSFVPPPPEAVTIFRGRFSICEMIANTYFCMLLRENIK